MTGLVDRAGEAFEALSRTGHQLRHGREVPIGIAHLGVADIGGQGEHGMVEVGPVRLPEGDPATDEGVSEVVDSRRRVRASGDPPSWARSPAKTV